MARPNKPWHRKQTGWWMVKLDGKQQKLVEGPRDEEHRQLAEEKFVELRKLRRLSPVAADARVVDVVEAFLKWSRENLAEDTHRVNKYYLQLFAEGCGQKTARLLIPYDVECWVSSMKSGERLERDRRRRAALAPKVEPRKRGGEPRAWGDTTVYNAKKAALRVFSWAKAMRLLSENPLAGMPNPKPRPRQRAITDGEFRAIHGNAGGPLGDLLLALYLTAARPKEVRDLTWDHALEDRWVLPEHKTAKKSGKARVVFLPVAVKEMMARLRGNGHTHVFLNTVGEPWTATALRQQVWRIKRKLGLADDLCAYLCRHGFGTRAILSGVDGPTLAELMGHASQDMISKVYVHLADQHQHLRAAVEKVSPSTPGTAGPGPVRRRSKPVDPRKPGPKGKGTP